MNYFVFVFVILSFTFFSSCDSDQQLECIRVSSETNSEIRAVEGFNGVVLNHSGELILKQDSDFSVQLSGPENVVELMETTMEGEKLIIGSNECFNGEYDLKVEVSAPEFQSIQLFGNGEVKTVGLIEGNLLQVEIQGSATLDLDFNVDSLYTVVWGSNTMYYGGEVIKHQFTGAGEFSLEANSLSTRKTSLLISGIGDSYVHASDSLHVVLTGTGNVYYRGNPAITSKITGTGEIIDNN